MADQLTRLIFDDYNIRGVAVKVTEDVAKLISDHDYPEPLASLLLEAVVINAMLCTTLKFEGRISLQLQTPGALTLLLVQTTHELDYRGIVRFQEELKQQHVDFAEMTQNGQLVITIEPDKGQRYQGIVALESNSLASCIEGYFAQSEQLKTRLFIFSQPNAVFGLFIQALPDLSSEADFEHVEILANTLTREEAIELTTTDILQRLFHEEKVRELAQQELHFRCGCNQEKMLASIQLIGEEEIQEILQSEGHVEVQCEFCRTMYQFNDLDIKQFQAVNGNQTMH